MEKTFKILIIDDDLLVHRIYTRVLTPRGYSVSTCDSAVGIFKTINEHCPDIILMDYQMPVVSGMEAIKQLKYSDIYKSIPIIFFSSVPNLALLAKEAGADAYLSKSSPHKDLFAIVQNITAQLLLNEYTVK